MDKTKGVMTALKGRKDFGSKKGASLLGLIKKLTAKRKENKEGAKHEMGEPSSKEAHEKMFKD